MQSKTKEVTPFNFGDNEIRVVVDETTNEPYWVAKDICDVLEYQNVSKTLQKLDDDEKLIYQIVTSGQKRDMQCINESGLYTLILRSNKPEAKKFKKWVTSEVLPTIRKTGSYSTKTNSFNSENGLVEVMMIFANNQQKQTDAILELIDTQQAQNNVIMDFAGMVTNFITKYEKIPEIPKCPPSPYLDSRDRKKLRDAIQEKAKEVAGDLGVSVSTISPAIWIELKNFFDVDDYQDIHKDQLKDVMHFVMFWEPKKRYKKEQDVKITAVLS